MEFYRTRGLPDEEITHQTARMAVIQLSETSIPYVDSSVTLVRRYAVTKSTENRAESRTRRLFIDLSGPFHETRVGGKRYVMLCVEDFSRCKFVRFFMKESNATEGLHSTIN